MLARTATLLAAIALTVLQPLATACQCSDCSSRDSARQVAANQHKSCCSTASHARRSCCEAAEKDCPCGSCSDDGATGESCLCSAQPRPSAVIGGAVEIDHSSSGHAWLAVIPPAAMQILPSTDGVAGRAHAPPGHSGALRLHAFLGVWLI